MIKMLTTEDVAQKMGISIVEARKIIKQHNFPKLRISPRKNLIPEDAFEKWLFNNNNELWEPLMYGDLDLTKRYEVSNTGKLRSIKSGAILKQFQNDKGYMTICISLEHGGEKVLKMHRAVAFTFLDNPYNYPEVNHLDGDKTNNHVTNLQWCTGEDNKKHAIKTGLFKPGTYKRKMK